MKEKTRRGDHILVFVSALVIRLVAAGFIHRPGYMDTAYYAVGAARIAQGRSFSEPFIWNYLNDPAGIPHPGFLYWMPLPSLLAAPFAALLPGSFFALQIPFSILAALLSSVAYGLAWQATRQRGLAWGAGLVTTFSGFFFPYWTLPETFAPFALCGSLALWLAGRPGTSGSKTRRQLGHWLLVGLLAGLAHLSRADGIVLLPVVALGPLLHHRRAKTQRVPALSDSRIIILSWSATLIGYLIAMGPWFLRNVATIGSPLSPAGSKTLWLTEYDDIFCYQCDLSLRSFLDWGWSSILTSKLTALWINLQRFLAEDCMVFLFPLVVIGLWRMRRRPPFVLAIIYGLLLYVVHSLAFTFPGWRGGFFHSTSALLPFLYGGAMVGLDTFTAWGTRKRGWRRRQAQTTFTVAVVLAAMMLSIYVAWKKVPTWHTADNTYREIKRWLEDQEVPHAQVMVGNPPAFWYHTRHPAVVVPNGGVRTVLSVCDRYNIDYVVLESNHPADLDPLYDGQITADRLQLEKILEEGSVLIWHVD